MKIIILMFVLGMIMPVFAQSPSDDVVNQLENSNNNLNNTNYGLNYKIYAEPLILVIIPTILGVILAPRLTKSWQFRSAKIQMKKEVLEYFSKSGINQIISLHQFMGRIMITYGTYDIEKYDMTTGFSTLKFTIPSGDESKLPKNLLKEEFLRLQSQYDESKLIHEPKFISLMELYYRDKTLGIEYFEIQKKIGKLKTIVYSMMNSTKTEELEKLSKVYDEIYPEFKTLTPKLRNRLITQEIIIPEKELTKQTTKPNHQLTSEKTLALLQVLGTFVSSVGGIIIAMGISVHSFSMNYTLIPLGDTNLDVAQLYATKEKLSSSGWHLITLGSSILIIGLGAVFTKIIRLRLAND